MSEIDFQDGDGELLPAEAIAWPPGDLELTLRKPVTDGDESVYSLMLREPSGDEWEQIFAHPAATRRRFAVSLIAGVPMKVCARMAIGDLVRAEKYINAFFEVGQAISDW